METTRRELLKSMAAVPLAAAVAAHLPATAAANPLPTTPVAGLGPAVLGTDLPEMILGGPYPLFRFRDGTVVNYFGFTMTPHTFPNGASGYIDTYYGSCLRLLDATIADPNGVKIADAGWGMELASAPPR